jgi:hypothetical protein
MWHLGYAPSAADAEDAVQEISTVIFLSIF